MLITAGELIAHLCLLWQIGKTVYGPGHPICHSTNMEEKGKNVRRILLQIDSVILLELFVSVPLAQRC